MQATLSKACWKESSREEISPANWAETSMTYSSVLCASSLFSADEFQSSRALSTMETAAMRMMGLKWKRIDLVGFMLHPST